MVGTVACSNAATVPAFSFNKIKCYKCNTQPVTFGHSSRGLGHDPNKHFASVATDALLAGTLLLVK